MTSPVIGTPWKKLNAPVSEEALEGVDKYWRVANYLSIGQIYLRSNPLMKEPFTREDVIVFLCIVFQFTVLGIACNTGLCRYGCHLELLECCFLRLLF